MAVLNTVSSEHARREYLRKRRDRKQFLLGQKSAQLSNTRTKQATSSLNQHPTTTTSVGMGSVEVAMESYTLIQRLLGSSRMNALRGRSARERGRQDLRGRCRASRGSPAERRTPVPDTSATAGLPQADTRAPQRARRRRACVRLYARGSA